MEIQKTVIEFTVQEKNDLMNIIDAYTRAQGINGAQAALYFAIKFDNAFTPKKIEEKAEEKKE